MDETMMNAMEPEVVQPESTDNSADSQIAEQSAAAVAEPRDIENMSDDDFNEYLKQVQSGNVPEVPKEEPQDEPQPEDTEPEDTQEEIKPYKVYKTHEEFQQDFDRIMGERLKKNRESLDLYDKVKLQARNFYGDAADDTAAVNALLADLTNQNADRRGVETDEYNRQIQDAEDARRWREQQRAASEQEQRQNAQRERLERDIADVKRIAPAFDFNQAMQNETFRKAIMDGASVQTAYMIANQPKAQKPKRQPIKQVGMQSGVSGRTDYDPAKLPDDEFDAYVERIMNR